MHQILLVEDDALLREGLRQVLEEDGFRVAAAAEGSEALDLLHDRKIAPCFILTDLMMPGMNGWDFLKLHGRQPALSQIPIAVASAYPFAEKEVRPALVLRKPFSPSRLKSLIEESCLCARRPAPRAPVQPGA